MKIVKLIYILILPLCMSTGCGKFLNEKSDKALSIPSSLDDYQALLDYRLMINANSVVSGEMSTDNYYITTASYNGLNFDYARNIYTWAGAAIEGGGNRDWEYCYSRIYRSTVVLEALEKIRRTIENRAQWDNLKGQALALRAYRYLDAAAVWSKAYDEATADTDLGIPLRQTTDFNEPSVRVTVQETYDAIINSLNEAIPLLPTKGIAVTRADRQMAYSTLARTLLLMRKYKEAGLYADSALQIGNKLLDFNILIDGSLPSIEQGLNEEVVFYMTMNNIGQLLNRASYAVDSLLYQSFSDNDLRKSVLFRENVDGSFFLHTNYASQSIMFSGITHAELYLMRAECYAREGKVTEAMADLNALLENRLDNTQPFIPLTATNKEEALEIILSERRKELMFRGLRWPDIKRLNKDGANITLTRIIDGKMYTLPPNDNRYALPIPEDIILLSDMPQNPQ